MNITESILRILSLLESARVAAKVLLACGLVTASAWLLRESIRRVADDLGISQVPIYGVLALSACATVVLLVEGALWARIKFGNILDRRARAKRLRADAEVERERRAEALKRFLVHAPPECLRPLRELTQSVESEYKQSGELRQLKELGAIEELLVTRQNHAVFRLASDAETIVRRHFAEERANHVRTAVQTLTANELAFLQLFTVTQAEYEDPERTDLLPRETYAGGESLIRKKLVERRRLDNGRLPEQWTLCADAMQQIEGGHGLSLVRDSMVLGLDRVQGSGASGSGAGLGR